MKIFRAREQTEAFSILETTGLSQHAFMILQPGEASSESPSVHPTSDQALVLLEGELRVEIGGASKKMESGDAVLVAAGTPHRFLNSGSVVAVSYTTYSPPAY